MSVFPNYTRTYRGFEFTENDWYVDRIDLEATSSTTGVLDLCVPWEPTIVDERAEGEQNPDYKLYLNLGAVNGVINPNWASSAGDINEGTAEIPGVNYIVLDISLGDGQVTSVAYDVTTNLPSAQDLSPVRRNTLPSNVKVIIGTVVGTEPCMMYHTNIFLKPSLVFQRPNGTATYGEPRYDYYYTVTPYAAALLNS